MAIAATLSDYLNSRGAVYSVLKHQHTSSSLETAEAAHVPGDQLAKPVVLHDGKGYVMAVIPATHKARLGVISQLMHRKLSMALEDELGALFKDCELGAVPAIGRAYDVEMVWDDSLATVPDIYFESGDHEILIHMLSKDFKQLMQDEPHGQISSHI